MAAVTVLVLAWSVMSELERGRRSTVLETKGTLGFDVFYRGRMEGQWSSIDGLGSVVVSMRDGRGGAALRQAGAIVSLAVEVVAGGRDGSVALILLGEDGGRLTGVAYPSMSWMMLSVPSLWPTPRRLGRPDEIAEAGGEVDAELLEVAEAKVSGDAD